MSYFLNPRARQFSRNFKPGEKVTTIARRGEEFIVEEGLSSPGYTVVRPVKGGPVARFQTFMLYRVPGQQPTPIERVLPALAPRKPHPVDELADRLTNADWRFILSVSAPTAGRYYVSKADARVRAFIPDGARRKITYSIPGADDIGIRHFDSLQSLARILVVRDRTVAAEREEADDGQIELPLQGAA